MLEMRAARERCGEVLPHDGDARGLQLRVHLLPRLHQRTEGPLPQLRRRVAAALRWNVYLLESSSQSPSAGSE